MSGDSQGNLYLAYVDSSQSDGVIDGDLYVVRRASGGSWSGSPELVGSFGSDDPPALATDSQDNLVAAWGTGDLLLRQRTPGGQWGSVETALHLQDQGLDLVVDDNDIPRWITGDPVDSNNQPIWTNGDAGAVNLLDGTVEAGVEPTLAVGPENTLLAVWESNDRLYQAEQTDAVTKHYYLNGQRLATRVDGELYYIHGDHLGSTSLVTDESGNEVSRVQYSPYGSVISSTGSLPTDRLFTGQRLEESLGLYDYRARFYDPLVGSFISADTLVPEPGNPRAFNRYAYVMNNPVRYTDPSGHCYGIASGVRGINIPYIGSYDTLCNNLDQAILVAGHPEASAYDRTAAVFYAEGVILSHAYLGIAFFIGGCGLSPTCATAAGYGTHQCLQNCQHAVEQGSKLTVKAANGLSQSDGASIAANKISSVALSLHEHLFNFQLEVVPGAKNFTEWQEAGLSGPTFPDFSNAFNQAMNNTAQIHFNLTGMNIDRALQQGALGFYGAPDNVTNAELYLIINNPDWFAKTTFYLNGASLSATEVSKLLGVQ